MISVDVRTNIDDVLRNVQRIPNELRDKATAAALNKTIDKCRTAYVRNITSEYVLQANEVRPALSISKASAKGNRLVAFITPFQGSRRGRTFNLIRFLEKKITLAEAKRRQKRGTLAQLGFRIRRGTGIKQIPGAFIGNKGRTVFRRIPGTVMKDPKRAKYAGTKHAEALEALTTIGVPGMFNARKVARQVVIVAEREFPIELTRALRLVLR